MKNYLDENIFELLDKVDLYEDLDPSIDESVQLYEDDDFSKSPKEADERRVAAEKVLGFELNGNQVQWLADNFKAFYNDANKYAKMKDQILEFMAGENLLPDNKLHFDDIDSIDYHEESNPDALHPSQDKNSSGFQPIPVQSWDKPEQTSSESEPHSGLDDMSDIGNEIVSDDYDDISEEEVNKILTNTK